jgi:DNA adenine methylase
MSDIVKPLLHWVGGRAWLAPRINEVFQTPSTYYEPFLGGASVFLYLASMGKVKSAVLTDGSSRLINMYRQVQQYPEEVSRALDDLPKSEFKTHYYSLRDRFNNPATSQVEGAALLLWLNKTGFNGLYRENASGGYNVPVGTAKDPYFPTYDHILKVSSLLDCAVIWWMYSDEWVTREIEEGANVYADPPYVEDRVGGFTGYVKRGFGPYDQEALARRLTEISYIRGVSVAVSNHNTPLTRELYKDFNQEAYTRKRLVSAGAREDASELFCYV